LQLSAVKDGVFTLATGEDSTKLFAGLGATNPFVGVDGPGVFDTNVPYALSEWTIKGNQYDNLDVSYIDSFSFPTVAIVKDSSRTETGRSGFKAGTQASDVIS
jgi:protease II